MLGELLSAAKRLPAEIWRVLVELSPSLLLGLALAGALHVFLPRGWIRRRLSGSRARSVVEAVALGVPMPLCSCGVVPTALGLRNQGASRGAATGFLIATPQTGVDSVAVSASLLGWPFALFKLAAAAVTGLAGGLLVNATEPPGAARTAEMPVEEPRGRNPIVELLRYALFELLAMIDVWIVVGVLVSAVISIAIPAGALEDAAWAQGPAAMLIVLVVAIPIYVCSTSSVPIAAALIAAGMPTGAALVFLMSGPATNAATIGAVHRALGGRVLAIYLSVVAVFSTAFGLLFDFVLGPFGEAPLGAHEHGADWLGIASAALVAALIVFLLARRAAGGIAARFGSTPGARGARTHAGEGGMKHRIRVEGMTCEHCVASVERALEAVEGVVSASPDLRTGLVEIEGDDPDPEAIREAVEAAGYRVEP